MAMVKVRYRSNNSGGSWWLSDEDWKKLEEHGWKVRWFSKVPKSEQGTLFKLDEEGRWLGALASEATKRFLSLG